MGSSIFRAPEQQSVFCSEKTQTIRVVGDEQQLRVLFLGSVEEIRQDGLDFGNGYEIVRLINADGGVGLEQELGNGVQSYQRPLAVGELIEPHHIRRWSAGRIIAGWAAEPHFEDRCALPQIAKFEGLKSADNVFEGLEIGGDFAGFVLEGIFVPGGKVFQMRAGSLVCTLGTDVHLARIYLEVVMRERRCLNQVSFVFTGSLGTIAMADRSQVSW